MFSIRKYLVLVAVTFGLTSCIITDQIRVMQVEVMKPGALIFPENVDKLAIFKRDIYHTDAAVFNYFYKHYDKYGSIRDSTISYLKLSNHCVDELAEFFRKEGYFTEVKNYRDSLNEMWHENNTSGNSNKIFKKADADVCIFLDYFKINNASIFKYENVMYASPMLKWTIILKGDASVYVSNQIYDKYKFPQFFT